MRRKGTEYLVQLQSKIIQFETERKDKFGLCSIASAREIPY